MVNARGAFAIGETPIALRFFKKPRRRVRRDETFTAHRAGTEPLPHSQTQLPKQNPKTSPKRLSILRKKPAEGSTGCLRTGLPSGAEDEDSCRTDTNDQNSRQEPWAEGR